MHLGYFQATAFGSYCLLKKHLLTEVQHEDEDSFLRVTEQKVLVSQKCINETVWQYFRTLGWITVKLLFDSHVMDLPLSEAFLEML
ncbi:hypothetical protein L0F63_004299, partial [Massospora cicadina]